MLELNNEIKLIRVSSERVLDTLRISGVKVIHNGVTNIDIVVSVNACREREMCIRDRFVTSKTSCS